MKLAIASDFHIGFNDDALAQARQALDKASVADAVLLPGDLLDWRVPSLEVLHDAIRLFANAKTKGSTPSETHKTNPTRMHRVTPDGTTQNLNGAPRLIAIYGTHERRAKGMSNSIQLLDAAGLLTNCHATTIMLEKDVEDASTKGTDGKPLVERVAIQGMGGVPEEYSNDVLRALDFKPVPGAFNVFIFHQTLREAIPQATDGLNAADLPPGFDLYVDGHIHWHAMAHTPDKKPVLLPGSTVITQMKKGEMEPKRVFFIDTLKAKTPDGKPAPTAEWIMSENIASRPFHYLELTFENATLSEIETRTRAEVEKVTKNSAMPPLVKVKLYGTLKKGVNSSVVDAAGLERELAALGKVSIDKEFDTTELNDQIEHLRKLRHERQNAAELGLNLLHDKLKAAKWTLPTGKRAENAKEPTDGETIADARELFELLAEGEIEKAQATLDNA